MLALERAEPGSTLAIGAQQPRSNLQVVRSICAALDEHPAGPGRPPRAVDPFRDRPARPRFPLRDRPGARPRRRWTGTPRTISTAGCARRCSGMWTTAPGGSASAPGANRATPGTSTAGDGVQDEGHPAGRRLRHPAAPDDDGGVQAVAAGVRQADGVLPALGADAVGDTGYPDHLDPRRPADVPPAAGGWLASGVPVQLRRAALAGRAGAGVPDRGGVAGRRGLRAGAGRQHDLRRPPEPGVPGDGQAGERRHGVRLPGARPRALRRGVVRRWRPGDRRSWRSRRRRCPTGPSSGCISTTSG